ncbi:MAG: hypothetical protein WBM90_08020 [Acidimicrobiia bacterium]
MFDLENAPVPVRPDIPEALRASFRATARPGGVFTGAERVDIANTARTGEAGGVLSRFARHLYSEPATVEEEHVREAADRVGDPAVVETIGIVSRLSSVDRFHTVLGIPLEPLPEPEAGEPNGKINEGLKRRRGHVPMPPGPIPVALDLVSSEAEAFKAMFGPMYMTEEEMSDPDFGRSPGLDTPQLEIVAARVSLINRCFY